MEKSRSYKILKTLLITLFLVTRFSTGIHAAEFGNGPHKHDNKICALILSLEEDDKVDFVILPNSIVEALVTIPHIYSWSETLKPNRALKIVSKARAPPKYINHTLR